MGILDDAIKEHLELKRQHGAAESELKQLEDEAFGAAERPGAAPQDDSLAEASTQFMTRPEGEEPAGGGEEAVEADDQAPSDTGDEPPADASAEPGRPAPRTELTELQEAPPPPQTHTAPEPEVAEEPAPDATEESPASEHDLVPEISTSTGPTTEEREAIAEHPTEMYDVEAEEGDAGREEYDEDDDFWDEKRLSDELDQALEAPSDPGDEEDVFSAGSAEAESESGEEAQAEEPPAPREEEPRHEDEDVLEETPDFLEESEDDQLWFEQKPPKDFDFDD